MTMRTILYSFVIILSLILSGFLYSAIVHAQVVDNTQPVAQTYSIATSSAPLTLADIYALQTFFQEQQTILAQQQKPFSFQSILSDLKI
jgi:hypothetical protein